MRASSRLFLSLLLVSSASGFINPSSSLQHGIGRHRHGAVGRVNPSQSHCNDEAPAQTDAQRSDDERRRQLLSFILASAAGVPFSALPAAAKPAVLTRNGMATAAAITSILAPPLDDRKYLAFTLENGLSVLLCSDTSSNEAAACMNVHVGATADTIPGLAHFTEHMLFLGTAKYPREDSFESFLSTNGGKSNAYTDSENTVYFFDIEAEARLEEGLDRFASFFVKPLFTASATAREVNAIDSEHSKNLQSDAFRIFQLTKARANQYHPFSKFFTGNKETLQGNVNLRPSLVQFYESYYSANQMSLAVVAPQSVEELRSFVTQSFGKIPNRQIPPPEKSWEGIAPFTSTSLIPSFGHMVQVVPVQDLRQVQVSWPLLNDSDDARHEQLWNKPTMYVAHLLGHEGPNSLLSYLKGQGWANSLAASEEEDLSDFRMFAVVVGLTTQGLASMDQVVEAIYSYLTLLRERRIPNYVMDEVLLLDDLSWRFANKGSPRNYVTSLATNMQKYPPELYVAGPRRLALPSTPLEESMFQEPRTGFSSREQLDHTRDLISDMVKDLTVENAIVSVLSKTFEGQTDQKEKWYGTDYRVAPIPSDTMDRWKDCKRPEKMGLDFPKPNPFLPTEAGLQVRIVPSKDKEQQRTFESRMTPLPSPEIIRDDAKWTVYYKQDDRFGLPKAYVIFQICTKDVFSSAEQAALGNLFEICVSDKLEEYAYDASLAGLTYDVRVLSRGIRLTFGGYNEKLQKFAAYVTKKLTSDFRDLLPSNDNEFGRYKDQVMRGLSTFDVKQPYAHASYYAQLTLQPRHFQYTNAELRDATRKMTLPDLKRYVENIWNSGKGEALVQGNVDRLEALDMVRSIGDVISFRPIDKTEYPPRVEALPLPPSKAQTLPPRLLISEPNPFNENSVSYVMLQGLGKSEKDHVLIELINAIIEEPFYNELRTKRQLGYIVSSGIRGVGDTRTLAFIVQSSVAQADALTVEILAFLDTVQERLLEKISKIDLMIYVKSLIDRKTEPDKDLSIEITRNWSEIASGRFQFDRIQKEAAALLEIEKSDIIDYWKEIYGGDGRRVLITQIIPRRGVASSEAPLTSTRYESSDLNSEGLTLGIDDIQQFRLDREKFVTIG